MKWTIVTGACGGLGQAFCRQYAQKGCALLIQGRSQNALDELKRNLTEQYHIQVETIICDFSDSEQTKQFCEELKSYSVERLICNAGFGEYGLFIESDIVNMMAMNEVNMNALMMLNHAVLHQKTLKEILNVASTAAFQPGPWMAVYYATKAYVLSFSQALAVEVKPKGIQVSVLCCGPMETGFSQRANLKHTWMQKLVMISADDVAQYALKGMKTGKICIIPGFLNRIAVQASSTMPFSLKLKMMTHIQSKRK